MAQDHAAEAQIGLHVEQPHRLATADQPRPERHYLHVAARTGTTDRVLSKAAFHLDQAEHQCRVETGPLAFVPDGLEKLDAGSVVRLALLQAVTHFTEPTQVSQPTLGAFERRFGR